MKIVNFWQSLIGSGGFQEFNIIFWVLLAVNKFVYLLFAAHQVTVALEEALFEIVEYGEAQRLNFQALLSKKYALLL